MQASRVNYSNERSTWVTKGKNLLYNFGLAQRPRPHQQNVGMQLPNPDNSYNQPLNNQNQALYNQPMAYQQQGYNYPQQPYVQPMQPYGGQPMYNPQMPPTNNNYAMGVNQQPQPMGIYNPPAQSYNQAQPQAQQNTGFLGKLKNQFNKIKF